MLIPSIIISQTGSRPEQSWRTTEALWDRIMKQTGLWATSASCYHQVLSAWLEGQVYMDLAGPLTPLHLHLPQYQEDSWDSPSRYELYVSWAGSTLRLTCQFTICQKNHGLLFHPRGSLFSHTWVHGEGHEADWDKLVTSPKSSPGNVRADVGLRHQQDVRMTDPFKPKGWAVLSLQEYQVGMYWGNSLQGSLKWQHLEGSKILHCFIREFIHFSMREMNTRLHLGPKASSHRNLKQLQHPCKVKCRPAT